MTPENVSLPELLKSEREKRRLTPQEVSQKTRIPSKFIVAMESGEWGVFPAEVYRVGFLRDYAEFLRLSAETVVQRYREETQAADLNKPESLAADVSLEKIKTEPPMVKNVQVGFLAVLVVVGVLLGRKFVRVPFKNVAVPGAVATAETGTAANREAREGLYLLSFKVQVVAPVWMRVQGDDGRLLFEGHVQPGAARTWNAVREMVVRIGNIRAVSSLSLNGKPFVAQPRPKSAVVELLFNQTVLKQVESQPNPVLDSVFLSTPTAQESMVFGKVSSAPVTSPTLQR